MSDLPVRNNLLIIEAAQNNSPLILLLQCFCFSFNQACSHSDFRSLQCPAAGLAKRSLTIKL